MENIIAILGPFELPIYGTALAASAFLSVTFGGGLGATIGKGFDLAFSDNLEIYRNVMSNSATSDYEKHLIDVRKMEKLLNEIF